MTDERDHLIFSQRYGYEPLPTPMRLEEISDDLRREIWNAVYRIIRDAIRSDMLGTTTFFDTNFCRFIERVWGKFKKISESRVRTKCNEVMKNFESVVMHERFNRVLDLLQIMADERKSDDEFTTTIATLFERHAAAYRLDMSRRPYLFVPCANKEQGEATRQAIETIRDGCMEGAVTHLRQAVEHINGGQHADSIADSIHAVESVARVIDPKSNKTLKPALNSLEKAGLLTHPALKDAFNKLYGYTSDEQGIRHALHDKGAADVGLDEAIFMFGACASFAAYLTEKHRKAGEHGSDSA